MFLTQHNALEIHPSYCTFHQFVLWLLSRKPSKRIKQGEPCDFPTCFPESTFRLCFRVGSQAEPGVSLKREHPYWISERLMGLKFAAGYKIRRGVMSALWTSNKLRAWLNILHVWRISAPKHSESSHSSNISLLPLNTMKRFHNTGHCIKFYKGPHSNKASSDYEP